MPRKKPNLHRKAGRPPYDPLFIYLFVESESRKHGLSAFAVCMRFDLVIVAYRNEPIHGNFEPRLVCRKLGGRTLYRRYMEAKRKIIGPVILPKGMPKLSGLPSTVPDDLELRINEMAEAR